MPFWAQRASKIASIARFHAYAHLEARPPSLPPQGAETLWFIKVVYSLCIQHCSNSLDIFHSDYFRESLTPFIVFNVIKHLNDHFNRPRLAFSLFQFTRINLNISHLVSTFHLLLRSLCQMGLHDSAKFVFHCMCTDGHVADSSTLNLLIESLLDAGKFEIAKGILESHAQSSKEKFGTVNAFVYNSFLSLLMRRNHVEAAVSFFRNFCLEHHGFCPDTCTFNIVIRGLCLVGGVNEAFNFFNSMQSCGCVPDKTTYNTLINGLCRVSHLDEARELLRKMHSLNEVVPDVVSYTSIISGYCKLERMEDAIGIFDEMVSLGISPNLITFNTLINGFGKIGDLISASRMFERMCSMGLLPDVVTFTTLIDGHCRAGELDQALKLWDDMNARQALPNLYTFSILINALCKENRIKEARALLTELQWREDITPKPFIYNPIVDGFCKAGNLEEANLIIAEMEAKGCHHDKFTFTILIIGHCMKGRMHEAISIFNKMNAVGCWPDKIAVNSLTSCLLKAGMVTEAYKIKKAVSEDTDAVMSSKGKIMPFRTDMDIPVAV